jgi:hypothetical protein
MRSTRNSDTHTPILEPAEGEEVGLGRPALQLQIEVGPLPQESKHEREEIEDHIGLVALAHCVEVDRGLVEPQREPRVD